MLKVIIVDDESAIRRGLEAKLLRFFSEKIEIIAQCGSVEEAKVILKATKPDVVFLDIELSDGVSFDIFDDDVPINYKIIFITAYNQYGVKAIKLGALDYLLKPIDTEELKIAVEKCINDTMNNTTIKENLDISKYELYGNAINKLVLRTSSEFYIVQFTDVLYCQSDGGYTTFYIKNGRKIVVSKSLKEYELILPDKMFIRTHQSYLVNAGEVNGYDREGYLLVNEDHRIPISTRKKEAVLSLIFS